MVRFICLLLLCVFFSSFTQAKPLTREEVPEPLKPWISWVEQDNPDLACPFLYNSYEQKRCAWPTESNLALTSDKGEFSISWQVYKESWVSLPGDSRHWPLNVTANQKTALVMDRDGKPSVKLAMGVYQLRGQFLWDTIPDNLAIPEDTGLINLTINGQVIPVPAIREGQLWLKESERGQRKPENIQNNLDIQVFRKVTDDVPITVLTRLVLDVSGEQREIKLAQPMPGGFIPLSLQSSLPARLEPDGQLLVQARPGHWRIDIASRSAKDLAAIPFDNTAEDWPSSEIWVFDARPDLRVVEIEQLSSIDPSQSNLPDEWQQLPAYRIDRGQAMVFKVIRRGDPEPEPNQLSINRKLWLDFDGAGYTVNDYITGTMTRGWRLNALPNMQTGKVSLNGDNQLITQQAGTGKQGVEVRKGDIILDADSRLAGPVGTISAVGWEQSFHSVNAELNLPPGWRLLAASGVDNVPDSWISRWTLMDLFLVLIAALATGRMWNYYWGLFALITLVIIWHEPGAPHLVWLNILAASALIKVLPQGRFLTLMNLYRQVFWLALVLITLPFMVEQVRLGLYPQLELPFQSVNELEYPASAVAPAPMGAMDMQEEMASNPMKSKSARALKKVMPVQQADKPVNFERIDPKANVQTGPGLPQWQWNRVLLSWNGSVDEQQMLHLWYLSPAMNMLLNFIRVAFIAVLALLMFGIAEKFKPNLPGFKSATPVLLWFLLLPILSLPSQNTYADYPSEALLNELKGRLGEVEIPDCLPACAEIQQMTMVISEQTVDISLQIHVQEPVMLPLPAEYGQWFPNRVLDNNEAVQALFRDNNSLWISLKPGGHNVILRGVTPSLSKFTLPLPLKPKRVDVDKTGWEVIGIQENGVPDDQLQFNRVKSVNADKSKPALEPGALPAFVSVERTLLLGLDWQVTTRITRLSPDDSAVVLNVPLLPGESVTSPGIHVKDGKVEVNIPARQAELQWQSTLTKSEKIDLTATPTDQWIEVWKADVSPIWHLETTGIAMIHLDNKAQWLPEWHPWPGEKITLQITRPEAVAGQTLTIDSSNLSIAPGQRTRDAALTFSARSSKGSQHTITLPENAELQSVAIDGNTQPLRQQGRKLTLPVNPGKQEITISWQESTPIAGIISTPAVDLGQVSVNTSLNVGLGQDRWVLFVFGPKLGPAVLFWGILIVIFIVSLGLGKIPLTPLKSRHWFLLLIGLSQIPLASAGVVIAWLMILGWRANLAVNNSRHFNLLQFALGVLTLVALNLLFYAVAQGLLSSPDMRITGNQSSAFNLNWYQDRSLSVLPTATVVSVPLMVYRLLMLTWSLWLAVSLLDWLRWGWSCFSSNGLWKKKPAKKPASKTTQAAE